MDSLWAREEGRRVERLVHQVRSSHEPVQLVSKCGSAILIGRVEWRAIQETIYLLSVPGMLESIVAGMATPVQECSPEVCFRKRKSRRRTWRVVFAPDAQDDAELLATLGIAGSYAPLLDTLARDPLSGPAGQKDFGQAAPHHDIRHVLAFESCVESFEKTPPPLFELVGSLSGVLSRPTGVEKRLIYQVLDEDHAVKVLRMWYVYMRGKPADRAHAHSRDDRTEEAHGVP